MLVLEFRYFIKIYVVVTLVDAHGCYYFLNSPSHLILCKQRSCRGFIRVAANSIFLILKSDIDKEEKKILSFARAQCTSAYCCSFIALGTFDKDGSW